ncbi:GNAT family N-acetyltransferase [Anaerosporobacter sp.]|uniref:GNAT family N-acetyltransferase n=1 Tax=Anaerosporobacter sp. TaxID=1872529 RepID=UPI0028A085DB|nr:GNAT family N-acetyltransferase [Anaerosporobacter sp.]
MEYIKIKKCNLDDLEKIKYISQKTFIETFSEQNTKEDIEYYLKKNLSNEQLKSEILNDESIFFIVEVDNNIAAYMKLNLTKAQTEEGHPNTLEVQRIYVLQEYKGKQIGKKLIQKAIETGKNSNLNYICWVYGSITLVQ